MARAAHCRLLWEPCRPARPGALRPGSLSPSRADDRATCVNELRMRFLHGPVVAHRRLLWLVRRSYLCRLRHEVGPAATSGPWDVVSRIRTRAHWWHTLCCDTNSPSTSTIKGAMRASVRPWRNALTRRTRHQLRPARPSIGRPRQRERPLQCCPSLRSVSCSAIVEWACSAALGPIRLR
jgi:hypothetical protein